MLPGLVDISQVKPFHLQGKPSFSNFSSPIQKEPGAGNSCTRFFLYNFGFLYLFF